MGRIHGHYEWDDDSLRPGQSKDGGFHQNLFDDDGSLKGSARFIPEDKADDDGSFLPAIAGLALLGLTATAVGVAASFAASQAGDRASDREERAVERADRSAQRWELRRDLEWRRAESRRDAAIARATQQVRAVAGWYDDGEGRLRWWDGYRWTEHCQAGTSPTSAPAGWYDDGSGRRRWWDGQEWTEHLQPSEAAQTAGVSLSPHADVDSIPPSGEVEVVSAQPHVRMTSAEWRERMRLMLIARTISEQQWVMLSNASIEDADPALANWQADLKMLTPQEFSFLINRELATNTTLRSEAQAVETSWLAQQRTPQPTIDGTTSRSPRPGIGPVRTETSRSTPAGWFDDGSGRLRWWDGHQWA